jgi:hypothetical protein
MASRHYTEKTIKLLFARSAFCAFPGCRAPLADKAPNGRDLVVAQIAHIAGLEPLSARHDPAMTSDERNHYDNLILLCGTHHNAYVDAAPDAYPLDVVRRWKREHEQWLQERLRAEMPRVGFAELEVVMRAIAGAPSAPTRDLILLPPAVKMHRNDLTGACGLAMGLAKVAEVKALLQKFSELDPAFPERLRAGFSLEYERLVGQDGLRGDELFFALRTFAAGHSTDLRMQDAALAVLSYLFEACEIFEK